MIFPSFPDPEIKLRIIPNTGKSRRVEDIVKLKSS